MNVVERFLSSSGRWLRHARWLVLALAIWMSATSAAFAQKKKKAAEEEAAPTKSYVAAYFIVIMALTVGLMTVLRPSKRLDKVPEKKLDEDED
jgi:hypothetical protein